MISFFFHYPVFFWVFFAQEHHQGNHNISITDTNIKQTVYVYNCRECTIQITGKINSIVIGKNFYFLSTQSSLFTTCHFFCSSDKKWKKIWFYFFTFSFLQNSGGDLFSTAIIFCHIPTDSNLLWMTYHPFIQCICIV